MADTPQSNYSDRIDELVSIAMLHTLPLHFIRGIKQKAIKAQNYSIAALLRDVERKLMQRTC